LGQKAEEAEVVMSEKSRKKIPAHVKAHATGRWAEIIFRALSSRVADRWRFVSFRGANKSEWRGVVDLVAIRKNSAHSNQGWIGEGADGERLPQTARGEAVIPRERCGAVSVEERGIIEVLCLGAEPQLAAVVE
jgi:hypothetical protein